MYVIAKPLLVEFWTQHPDAGQSLRAWYRTMRAEASANFDDLRAKFAGADHVAGLTVFRIAGNRYRLIALIHHDRHKVYIRRVLTHEEYDRGEWKRNGRD